MGNYYGDNVYVDCCLYQRVFVHENSTILYPRKGYINYVGMQSLAYDQDGLSSIRRPKISQGVRWEFQMFRLAIVDPNRRLCEATSELLAILATLLGAN